MNLEEIFKDTGLIAKHLKNYEFRPQQIRMAEAVEKSIASGRHLVVEAGTGAGKSLTYLIPFIKWSERNNKKVVISTHTKTLQEQLIKKDLPFLKDILGFNFRFALCLGGQNYLCLRRLNQSFSYELFEQRREIKEITRITKWREETATGLRLGLDFKVSESTWAKLCRESDLCLGKKCLYRKDCFYNKARLAEYKSHILVTNHHLYFANLVSGGKVLPNFNAVVFDEAHTLEDVATNYLGIELSNFKLKYFLDSIFNPQSGKGLLVRIRNLNRKRAKDLEKKLNESRIAAQSFFSGLISKFGEDSKILRIRNKNFIFNYLKEPLLGLASILAEFLDDAKKEEDRIEIKSFLSRGKEINSNLEAIINMSLDGYVYWIEILNPVRNKAPEASAAPSVRISNGVNRPRRPKYSLCAAPIDISGEFKDKVLDKVKPIIFTSATLSTNGNFEFKKRGLGIEDADELLLGSPFDYRENTLLYIPESLPDPSIEFESYQKEVIAEIKRILSIMNGRTFVLFTSFKMLGASYDMLKDDLQDLNILRQGDAPRYKLLERFKRQDGCVLLGTNTFWQGVDVPGRALECVIISKLPFAVPDDPITEAKMELLQSRNIDPFLHYQIPQAIIMLRQGFGRLIRTKTDRGVVAILDPRIKTRFYGKSFLGALPVCQEASRLEQVQRFFFEKRNRQIIEKREPLIYKFTESIGDIIENLLLEKKKSLRQEAICKLREFDEGEIFKVLQNKFNSNAKTKQRARVIWCLGELKIESAIGFLMDCLSDNKPNIRRVACSGLGKIQALEATESLVKVLTDPHPQVRQYAIKALGRIGGIKAVSYIERILTDPEEKKYNHKAASIAIRTIRKRKEPKIYDARLMHE